MKNPSARMRTFAMFGAAPLAVLVAGGMVWQGSQAAFTASTRNAGNSWSTGNVVLNDDDLGAAAFTVENIVPGQSGQKCIVVTSQSNVAGEVRAYTQNLITSRGMENRILIDLEQGTGGSFNDCTGFIPSPNTVPELPLSTLATVNKDFATGGSSWQTAGKPGETQSYRATWRFDTTGMSQDAVNALQGARVGIDLVWELQSDDSPSSS
ncbi:hypothetical protein [Arthrobacter burdickii]|uniref:Ribosomally synthesized peptide with SipW-like signal peptide n=1 Tax=Arthrobacter burdickii TaxID=3035920 RepID=A0ABT8JXQ4_9MICC|nr:hypothetical protein [Arthrobacter burdickii]MDN4609637.1 hypothetical protein [Arthrobacter burdickii]